MLCELIGVVEMFQVLVDQFHWIGNPGKHFWDHQMLSILAVIDGLHNLAFYLNLPHDISSHLAGLFF